MTGSTSASASSTSTPSGDSTPSTQPTCAAGSGGSASTRSDGRASTAARPRSSSPRNSTTVTSCSGSGSTAVSSAVTSYGRSRISHSSYARGTADLTDRQNIQLHWVNIEDVPAIWAGARGGRPVHDGGLRRHPAGDPRLPARGHRRQRSDRRDAGYLGHPPPMDRRPFLLQPAAQVQVGDERLRRAVHRARDQRCGVRGRDRTLR